MDFRMLPFSFRFEQSGSIVRKVGFDSQWRSFGNTLMTQVRGGRYSVRTAKERFDLEPGMAFLIPPGLRHRVLVRGDIPVTAWFTHLQCRVYELQGLFTVLERPVLFDLANGRRIGACTEALLACQQRGVSVATSAEVAVHVAELVRLAVAACPELETAWMRPERERLLPVLRYIQDHIAEPLDRAELARVAGVSIPHLHTLFLRAFGAAPMDVVRRERMQHARQLLHWSPLPIAEVGARCGFEDQYYFSRAFRRAEGVPPSRYRRDRQQQGGVG
jgi:AraC-like DNA-binding protein